MRAVAHFPYLISPAEALQRVFVPNWSIQRTCLRKRNPLRHQHRNLYHGPRTRGTTAEESNDGRTRDEGIRAREIQVVASDNTLQPPTTLKYSLASIDRQTQLLVQVGEKIHPRFDDAPAPEEGQRDPRPKIPVCKVVDKKSHRQAEVQKAKAKKSPSALAKEVECNWNIGPHDLDHRLKRMRDFLSEGKRVEVVFGKKRKGWTHRKEVTEDHAGGLVRFIRDNAAQVEGFKEWKDMEGKAGGELRMYFEAKGNKQKNQTKD
ncbi:MAG: hypothetical protein Q9186_003412 [Xanthomendoza sp. 1 TL-2023]